MCTNHCQTVTANAQRLRLGRWHLDVQVTSCRLRELFLSQTIFKNDPNCMYCDNMNKPMRKAMLQARGTHVGCTYGCAVWIYRLTVVSAFFKNQSETIPLNTTHLKCKIQPSTSVLQPQNVRAS